jgi:8-oxo-dGTP diphosphatase
MATAFLMNKDDFLLMQRLMQKKFAPGIWAGVGGHVEPEEVNNPYSACI